MQQILYYLVGRQRALTLGQFVVLMPLLVVTGIVIGEMAKQGITEGLLGPRATPPGPGLCLVLVLVGGVCLLGGTGRVFVAGLVGVMMLCMAIEFIMPSAFSTSVVGFVAVLTVQWWLITRRAFRRIELVAFLLITTYMQAVFLSNLHVEPVVRYSYFWTQVHAALP